MPAGSKKFRHAILKNLLLGLIRKGGAAAAASRGMMMSFHERRSAIRHAADAALATARGAAPRWSRSLAAELSQDRRSGRDAHLLRSAKSAASSSECRSQSKMTCSSKRIPRRTLRARPKSKATAKAAGVLARVMVRKRARALREIVPGGRGTDECTLLGETLDYAVSLKAQIEAMQLLLRTLQAPKNPSGKSSPY
ncbi:hypothetical protein BAE44_0008259 [Dichanthelium oligosanthes]|uniref:IBH1-like N-terminal domain-containing protein n=1 Tax=Dichanthelium oligosanthes TaxID=888268 RepID=A0A1E5W018_9POAL|nr:hypothetical protein BAE44_0008259 [Dichanthelium oligosanthes]